MDGRALDRLRVNPAQPPIRVIRQLLLAAFDADSLRRFCQDRPDFRELLSRVDSGCTLDELIDQVLAYCVKSLLWDRLLVEVSVENPREYARFEAELRAQPGITVARQTGIRGSSLASARDARLRAAPAVPTTPATASMRNRWALLVGVNRYIEPAFPRLKYCVNDVLALAQLLKGRGYTNVVLHDDLPRDDPYFPTRENVEAELARLCQVAGPDDLLWAHFACHGKLVDGQPRLITYETRAPTLAQRALPLARVEEQMRGSQARRLVLTLDACHTGVETGRDIADADFIKNAYDLAEGFALIAASTAQQVAQEWEAMEHGVFTYYLLEGLSGGADRAGKGFVTVSDLATHVLDGLRRWNVEHGGLLQEPNARTAMIGDMILADYRPH